MSSIVLMNNDSGGQMAQASTAGSVVKYSGEAAELLKQMVKSRVMALEASEAEVVGLLAKQGWTNGHLVVQSAP